MATSSEAIYVTRSEERRLRRTSASTQVAVKMLPKEEKTQDKEVPPQHNSGKKVSLKEKVEEIPQKQPQDTTKKTLASTQIAVKMSPKEEGARDKVVPPQRKCGKKVLASQGNAKEIPWEQPRDIAKKTSTLTQSMVKMLSKEEGTRDKVVPPRRKRGKKVLASQGNAKEIPQTQLRDIAQDTSASTQTGVKMLPKEKGAQNKVVPPQLQWKKALSQEEEVKKVPRKQPEDITRDLATDAPNVSRTAGPTWTDSFSRHGSAYPMTFLSSLSLC
jgi:hypothetical protein